MKNSTLHSLNLCRIIKKGNEWNWIIGAFHVFVLKENYIKIEGAKAISRALMVNTSLTELDLRGKSININFRKRASFISLVFV